MYIIFAIIAFIFLGLDFQKPSLFKLVFASSFMFCAIVAYKIPNNYLIQALSLLAFCGIFYFLIKKILKREQIENQKLKNFKKNYETFFEFSKKYATVTKDIGKTLSIDGIGKIEFDNETWSAKSINDAEIKAGNKVEIVSRENMILNVKKVE